MLMVNGTPFGCLLYVYIYTYIYIYIYILNIENSVIFPYFTNLM